MCLKLLNLFLIRFFLHIHTTITNPFINVIFFHQCTSIRHIQDVHNVILQFQTFITYTNDQIIYVNYYIIRSIYWFIFFLHQLIIYIWSIGWKKHIKAKFCQHFALTFFSSIPLFAQYRTSLFKFLFSMSIYSRMGLCEHVVY